MRRKPERLWSSQGARSYARVCSFFDVNDSYCFVDDKPRTFEQRLCSSEIGKKAAPRNSWIAPPRISAGILLSVALSSLMLVTIRLIRTRFSVEFNTLF
ncbi:hypothetical protein OSTOST_05738 [Ostertagia ostertagi]